MQQRVCVSLFFAINWTREVISMFCAQASPASQAKVLQRLSHLHLLEQQLEVCLKALHVAGSEFAFLPDAHDPCAALGEVANPSSKKKAKGEKKKKADKEGDAGGAAAALPDGPDDFLRVRSLASRFRFIDLDAVKILSYVSSANPDLQFASLRPFALHALIAVVHANCEALLEPAKKATPFGRAKAPTASKEADSRWAGKPLQALEEVIMPAVPALNENLQRLGQIIKGDESEWTLDEEQQFDHEAASESPERQKMEIWWYVIPAQRMVMEIFARVLRWLQLTSVKLTAEEAKSYDRLARQFFEALAPPLGVAAGSGSAELRKTAYNYLVCYQPSIQTVPSAVSYARLLEMVALYGVDRKFLSPALHTPDGVVAEPPERALLNSLSKTCDAFLRRKWSAASGGAKSADVRVLLETHLKRSIQPTAAVQVIVAALEKLTGSEALSGDVGDEQDAAAAEAEPREELHTLSKATLPLFFKSAFQALVNVLRDVDFKEHERWSAEQRVSNLKKLIRLNTLFCQLVSICKKKVPTAVHASALREGKLYVETFQLALPMLGITIQLHLDDRNESKRLRLLIKRVQAGTRVMQTMCACAKSSGEKALLTLVPTVKKALNKFVFEVKRMMNSLGLRDAVIIGSLKHKDMDGNELGSQVTYMVEAPEEEEEEEDAEEPEAEVLCFVDFALCLEKGEDPTLRLLVG
jgi:Fanconi anemia group D2 protein